MPIPAVIGAVGAAAEAAAAAEAVAAATAEAGILAAGAAAAIGLIGRRTNNNRPPVPAYNNVQGLPGPGLPVLLPPQQGHKIFKYNQQPQWCGVGVVSRPEVGPCDVPWAMYKQCGGELFGEGGYAGVQYSFDYAGNVGYARGIPDGCVPLITTLSTSCGGGVAAGAVAPVPCGDNCFQYAGVQPEAWYLFTNMTERRLGGNYWSTIIEGIKTQSTST